MNILVVEDTPQSLYLLDRFLSGSGHAVWSAANGREALDQCAKNGAPDLIVSDALMPAMDGFELCYALRRDPALCNVPFILYTATYTAESDERFALSVGVDRFVIKPTEPERLLQIMHEVCDAVRQRAPRTPRITDPRPAFFEEYARRVSLKLEHKVDELAEANQRLAASEREVRDLNDKLVANLQQIQAEVGERRRVEELLRLAFLVGRMGSWEFVARTGQVLFSSEALSLLDLSEAEADNLEVFLGRVEDSRKDGVRSFFRNREGPRELRLQYQRPQKGRRHLMLRKREVPDDLKSPVSVIGTVQDVTDEVESEARRLALEQQLYRSQKMEALGNLAGGVAHDFNNILTAIFGHAELIRTELEQEPQFADALSSVDEIVNAAERSRETIRQILLFSRRQSIERKTVRLARVVDEGLRLVRAVLSKRITLHADMASDRHVLANETQIHQVLLNLCTNAAYAMQEKGGTVEVSLRAIDIPADGTNPRLDGKSGPHVVLRVADTGCGIPADQLEHIFEPFFSTKPTGEGTGLGLAVVHGVVQSHEGAVVVESTVGTGTTFSLYFPAIESAQNDAAQREPTPAAARHVLIVDDEPGAAHGCMVLLTRLGYRATVVTDPVDARTRFLRNPADFDAAIIDSLMPRLTGADLARSIRAARPGFPLVMIAAFGAQPDLSFLRGDRTCELVTKPFASATLEEALTRVLP